MTIAVSRGLRKLGRTILQWILSLGSTGLTALMAEHLGINFSPVASVLFQALYLFIYTYAQNTLETAGKIPVLFPSPGLVSQVLTPVSGAVSDVTPMVAPAVSATVDAVSDVSGGVAGAVTDLTGGIVGKVTGQLDPEDDSEGHS